MVLGMMLERAGFDRLLVASGDAVIEALRVQERVDAVVLDVSMPGMNGIEAIKLIRVKEADEPPGKRMPLIAFSFDGHWRRRRDCFESGADAFLVQPVSWAMLIGTLKRAILERDVTRDSHSNVIVFPGNPTADRERLGELIDIRVVEELVALGGLMQLRNIARALQTDFTVALRFMKKAVDDCDVNEFHQQLFNMASAAGNLGSPRIRALYDRAIGCDEQSLTAIGSTILERLTLECEALCEFLVNYSEVHSDTRTSLPVY